MKLKLFVCLVLGMLAIATQAMAAPLSTPFLSVDINGYNAGGGESLGPTLAGFQGFEAAQGLFLDPSIDWGTFGDPAGLTNVYATSEGSLSVNMSGHGLDTATASSIPIARNRGGAGGPFNDMYQDIAFQTRGAGGFGQNWIEVQISGLTPGKTYEFTGFAHEPFNGDISEQNRSAQAWTDINALGGLDGPGLWMDANVGAGASYQPVYGSPADPMTDGTYKNPIPTLARGFISGPDPVGAYDYAVSVVTTADAAGTINVYTWADPQGYGGSQTATALNGFQISCVPEPASLALFGISLVGVALRRVR